MISKDLIAMGRGINTLLDDANVKILEVKVRLGLAKDEFLKAGLEDVAWFDKNSGGKKHPVGEKQPNMFGLHDMLGNVLEWCEDDWHEDYQGAPKDGSAWIEIPRDDRRVMRGGSWSFNDYGCSSSFRFYNNPECRVDYLGFRVVCDNSSGQ
jgi:formylglycine-generating enzyme required for sulfatase activity